MAAHVSSHARNLADTFRAMIPYGNNPSAVRFRCPHAGDNALPTEDHLHLSVSGRIPQTWPIYLNPLVLRTGWAATLNLFSSPAYGTPCHPTVPGLTCTDTGRVCRDCRTGSATHLNPTHGPLETGFFARQFQQAVFHKHQVFMGTRPGRLGISGQDRFQQGPMLIV